MVGERIYFSPECSSVCLGFKFWDFAKIPSLSEHKVLKRDVTLRLGHCDNTVCVLVCVCLSDLCVLVCVCACLSDLCVYVCVCQTPCPGSNAPQHGVITQELTGLKTLQLLMRLV